MRRSAVFVLLSLPALSAGAATRPAGPVPESATASPQTASALSPARTVRVRTGGGTVSLRWNDDLLRDLGISRVAGAKSDRFDVASGRIELDVIGASVVQLAGGDIALDGNSRFRTRAGVIDWTGARGVVRDGKQPRIDFAGSDGVVLFYLDSMMYELVAAGKSLSIPTADLRIAPALARRIGMPEAAGMAVADFSLLAPLVDASANTMPKAPGDPNWPGEAVPGVPGAIYEADVFMLSIDSQYTRCNLCDGPGGTNDGQVVFTPNSTLSNNRNNGTPVAVLPGDPRGTSSSLYTADVPWYEKFTSSPTNNPNFAYPYINNDQHPYLIWNLYRIDPVPGTGASTITQIGASGVKHAFLTTNSGSQCDRSNGSHVLGIWCTDTYSTGNNDSNNSLGPRSEIIPALGIWGRCGSIFDDDCNQAADASGNTNFSQRMIVRESDLDLALHPGATFYFESWYIIRDDVNVWNTMATRPFVATWNGSIWAMPPSPPNPYQLGPAIDRWVVPSPNTPVNQRNTEIRTAEGNFKVAVKATDLGNGTWRYDYAVYNADFARAETTGVESNHTLRVISNNGFRRFSVNRGPGTVTQLAFGDLDASSANDWTATDDGATVSWVAPSAAASLNWGTLYRFSFVSTSAPGQGVATLEPTLAGTPAAIEAATISAGSDVLFRDGFE
jgi:hypothetical protein